LLRTFDPVAAAVVVVGVSAGAYIDLRTRRVPNALTFGLAGLGFGLAGFHLTGLSISAALGGLLVGLLLMLPGHVIGATGAGDVKLLAALGTLLGPAGTATAFIYTVIAGGVLAGIVAVQRGRLGVTIARTATLVRTGGANVGEIEHPTAHNRFAYAPAIALGAYLAAFGA
jgi:prepilin peptidase CpaA